MATTPTDDPLANSDRTVGVRFAPLNQDLLKSLKRDALLFDQIGIREIRRPDPQLSDHIGGGWFKRDRPFSGGAQLSKFEGLDELEWLRDSGIVRGIPLLNAHSPVDRQYRDAVAAEMGVPIDDDISIPPKNILELFRPLRAESLYVQNAVVSRIFSINLRRDGINAFPILETRRQIRDVFPSGTSPVLEVILKSMPIPDDETPWEEHR
jgi:hypothetical protein